MAMPGDSDLRSIGTSEANAYRVSEQLIDMSRGAGRDSRVRVPARPQDVQIDTRRTAMIVVDMQNDFCHAEGWIGSMGIDTAKVRELAGPINRAAAAARSREIPILWVNWGVRADRLNLPPSTQHPFNPLGQGPGLAGERDGPAGPYRVLTKDSWGAAIIDDLVQDPRDIHVDKHRISGFWDTPLDAILRNLGITTLLFAGVNADHCVLGTLMDANFKGYDTIMIEDGVATTSPDFCLEATLHNVRFCFGFTITADAFTDALAA
jgi:ureidoacrylate peracid hydrolase